MQEDIRQQLKVVIGESEAELERLGDIRKQKRLELRQLRKALSALGGARQKTRKNNVLPSTSGGQAKPNADDLTR